MAIADGQPVNAAASNAAWVSRTTDTDTVGKIDLNNVDAVSGLAVTNTQKSLNGQASFSGADPVGLKDQLPAFNSNSIGTASDDLKERQDAVQFVVETNQSSISTNTTEISNIRTTTGTSTTDTNMGAYTGVVLTDNQNTKQNIQEVADQAEQNETDIATINSKPFFTFLGNWNAATNTPTLANGIGGTGDSYKVSVAGTVDFGAGNITFIVGDFLYYDGVIWDKDKEVVVSVAGKTGAVTLVAVDVTDFDTEVTNNVSVAANTAKVSADGSIDTHSDVDTSSVAPTDTQVLTWVNGNSMWEPKDAAAGGGGGSFTYQAKSGAYTALVDDFVDCDATGGAFTITLPTAVSISGQRLTIRKNDSSTNVVTVDGNAAETINGSLTQLLQIQNDALYLVSNGTNWMILSYFDSLDYKETAQRAFTNHPGPANTNLDILTISLTPGDWLISAVVSYFANGSLTTGVVGFGITNSVGNASDAARPDRFTNLVANQTSGTETLPKWVSRVVNVTAASENWFLKGSAQTSITNLQYTAYLSAKRLEK